MASNKFRKTRAELRQREALFTFAVNKRSLKSGFHTIRQKGDTRALEPFHYTNNNNVQFVSPLRFHRQFDESDQAVAQN